MGEGAIVIGLSQISSFSPLSVKHLLRKRLWPFSLSIFDSCIKLVLNCFELHIFTLSDICLFVCVFYAHKVLCVPLLSVAVLFFITIYIPCSSLKLSFFECIMCNLLKEIHFHS